MDSNHFVATLIKYLDPSIQARWKEMPRPELGLRLKMALDSAIRSGRRRIAFEANRANEAWAAIGTPEEKAHTVDTFARRTAQVLNMKAYDERKFA